MNRFKKEKSSRGVSSGCLQVGKVRESWGRSVTKQLYVRDLPNAQPLSNALCRYAPILIVSYYSMFLWAASFIYLDIDQAKMIVLRLLENIFGVSVRVRASQKQPVVE